MYSRSDVRLIGTDFLVDDLYRTLSWNRVSVAAYYERFRYPYIIIDILRPGAGLGNFALSLVLNQLARRWFVYPWMFITYREASNPPTEWTIQGTPDQVMRQLRWTLWWNTSCPYCGLSIPSGKFCDQCGYRLTR